MSTDRTADQNRSASKIDPEWIRQLQIGQKLKGDATTASRDEVVIVPIPDMREDRSKTNTESGHRPVDSAAPASQRREVETTSSLDHAVIIDETASSVIAANKEAASEESVADPRQLSFEGETQVGRTVEPAGDSISPLDAVVAKLKNQIANTTSFSPATSIPSQVETTAEPSVQKGAFPSIPMATPVENLPFDDVRETMSENSAPSVSNLQPESRPQINTDEVRNDSGNMGGKTPNPAADLDEAVSDWGNTDSDQKGSVERQAPTPVTASRELPDSLNIADEEIQIFVDKIQEKFSDRESIIVAFAGSESNSHVDHTCAVVSREIARRLQDDRVLLIDSDFDRRSLTEACDAESKIGVGNLLTGSETSLKNAIHVNQNRNLDFLPAGTQSVSNWHSAAERSAEICQKLKERYRVICVSLGDAHRRPASIWALRCDGVFLIVDLEDSSRVVAQSAVSHLHGCGAHVLGCVVAGGK